MGFVTKQSHLLEGYTNNEKSQVELAYVQCSLQIRPYPPTSSAEGLRKSIQTPDLAGPESHAIPLNPKP